MPLVNTAENTEFKTGTATGVAPTTHAGPSPAVERAVRLGHPILFGLLIALAIAELGVTASLVADVDGYLSSYSRVYFALFVAVWTVVFAPVYAYFFWRSPHGSQISSVLSHLVFVGLTWVFWLAAAAALTSFLGGGLTCDGYYLTDYGVSVCHRANAMLGLAWVEWVLSFFLLALVILGAVQSSRRGDGLNGGLVSA